MATYANTFEDVGVGVDVSVAKGNSLAWSVTGTFVADWELQRSGGKGWTVILTGDGEDSGTVTAERDYRYRLCCNFYDEGTMDVSLTENMAATAVRLMAPAALGKVGATAGWLVGTGVNTSMVTCPAGETASTLVVPVCGLRVGDKITGFYATGQIESAGNTATLDVALRKMTAAAADVVDAAVAAATQISVTADAAISSANSRKNDFIDVVGVDEIFYFLLTATTAASTDIALQCLTLELAQ